MKRPRWTLRPPVEVVIVRDCDHVEALYRNGERYAFPDDDVFEVPELVKLFDGAPVTIEHRVILFKHIEWPQTLAEALRNPHDVQLRLLTE